MKLPKDLRAKLRKELGPVEKFDWADVLLDAWCAYYGETRKGRNLVMLMGEEVVREHRFDSTDRRLDLALPRLKVAIECQGGENVHFMGHRSKAGTARDVRKANDAGLLGWHVLYFTGEDVRKRPIWCFERFVEVMQMAQERRTE